MSLKRSTLTISSWPGKNLHLPNSTRLTATIKMSVLDKLSKSPLMSGTYLWRGKQFIRSCMAWHALCTMPIRMILQERFIMYYVRSWYWYGMLPAIKVLLIRSELLSTPIEWIWEWVYVSFLLFPNTYLDQNYTFDNKMQTLGSRDIFFVYLSLDVYLN